VNVGGLYYKEGRRPLAKTIYVDEELEQVFRELNQLGVKLETRTTPTDPANDLMRLL